MKKPRTLKDIVEDPRVYSVHKEAGSYWVHLNYGWECAFMECGTIHESTVKDLIDAMNDVRPVAVP